MKKINLSSILLLMIIIYAIINAIKSATITYTTGLVTSMGPVTGTFGNTIS